MTFTAIYSHTPQACGVCKIVTKDSYTTFVRSDRLVYLCSVKCFRTFSTNYSQKLALMMSKL